MVCLMTLRQLALNLTKGCLLRYHHGFICIDITEFYINGMLAMFVDRHARLTLHEIWYLRWWLLSQYLYESLSAEI